MKAKTNMRKELAKMLKKEFRVPFMRQKSMNIVISDAFFANEENEVEDATVLSHMDTTDSKWVAVKKSLSLRSSHCSCVPSKCTECNSHHSLLHSILRYDPPSEIVQKVLDISDRQTLFKTDCQGRTPLYIAVLHKADHSVVKTLIQNAGSDAYKMCCYPIKSRDTNDISSIDLDKKERRGDHITKMKKKTPLHVACEVYDSQFYDLNQDLVIQELYRVAPFAALMEDSDGSIPLELAYLNGCSDVLLSKLHNLLRPYENKYKIMLTRRYEVEDPKI